MSTCLDIYLPERYTVWNNNNMYVPVPRRLRWRKRVRGSRPGSGWSSGRTPSTFLEIKFGLIEIFLNNLSNLDIGIKPGLEGKTQTTKNPSRANNSICLTFWHVSRFISTAHVFIQKLIRGPLSRYYFGTVMDQKLVYMFYIIILKIYCIN